MNELKWKVLRMLCFMVEIILLIMFLLILLFNLQFLIALDILFFLFLLPFTWRESLKTIWCPVRAKKLQELILLTGAGVLIASISFFMNISNFR
jgi:hypothetical protein